MQVETILGIYVLIISISVIIGALLTLGEYLIQAIKSWYKNKRSQKEKE